MKSPLLVLATALFAGVSASAYQAPAPAADPVVLTVGSEQVTQSAFEQIIATLSEQQRAALQTPEARRRLAEQIAELKVMSQEGRRLGLDMSAEVMARLALQRDQILASAVYQEMVAVDPSEEQLRAFYEEHKGEWEEAKGRHILIRTEGSRVPAREGQPELNEEQALAKAREVRAKIVAGAKFEDVAKTDSDDTGSGENGGELGSFTRGDMIPEFEDIAFSIPLGEVSEPVKTDFGYHLIRIDERGAKPFEEMREQIADQIRPEIGQKAVDDLKSKASITYSDSYFGAPPIPEPPKPQQ